MITQITIRQPGYGDFTLAELTKNNILLFSSPELKDRVAAEIEKIWLLPEDNDDSVLYSTTSPEEKTVPDGKEQGVRHFLTTTASLSDGQRFVFTVEPAFLYAAKDLDDIWFITEEDGKIVCHAFCEYIDSKKTWEAGPDAVYMNFVNGAYGYPHIPSRHPADREK